MNCGVYVLSAGAIERFPDIGDHESTTFPELAAEGHLRAFRHEGLWLTVNTPKELRRAQEHVAAHPEWLVTGVRSAGAGLDLAEPPRDRPLRVRPASVEKPWGSELIFALTDQYAGKILFVKAGESLSLQFHNVKDEAWYVLEGRAKLELGRRATRSSTRS